MRVVIGAALRRALRGRDVGAKLAALADVVRNSETHIANLARRLARGMTRRLVFAFAPEYAPCALAEPWAKLLHADSS
jgi:hypothetical protein